MAVILLEVDRYPTSRGLLLPDTIAIRHFLGWFTRARKMIVRLEDGREGIITRQGPSLVLKIDGKTIRARAFKLYVRPDVWPKDIVGPGGRIEAVLIRGVMAVE